MKQAQEQAQELNDKAKKMRKLYYKQWREKNPDKVRQYQQTYWLKKAAETLKQ